MPMINYSDYKNYAEQYTWAEILQSAGFSVEEVETSKHNGELIKTWVNDKDGPQPVRLVTFGEDPECLNASEANSQNSMGMLHKFQAIRTLHAIGDWNWINQIIESGVPLNEGPLASLGNARRAINADDMSKLTHQERMDSDPKYAEIIMRKRNDLEAQQAAKELVSAASAQKVVEQFRSMTNEEKDKKIGRIDWQDLWASEKVERWLVPGFICEGRGHLFYAPSGIGKSLLIQEIAVKLSTGDSILGFPAQSPFRVLYIDNENIPDGDIKPRIKDMGYSFEQLQNLFYLSFPDIEDLDTEVGGQVLQVIVEYFSPHLVVFDTFSRFIEGDENLAATIQKFYRWSGQHLKKRGIAYIRIDHTGKNTLASARGSSAKKDDVDLVWFMSPTKSDVKFNLENEKSRVKIPSTSFSTIRKSDPLMHVLDSGIDWDELLEYAKKPEIALNLIEGYVLEDAKVKLGRTATWNALRDRCKEQGVTRDILWDALERYKLGERSNTESDTD